MKQLITLLLIACISCNENKPFGFIYWNRKEPARIYSEAKPTIIDTIKIIKIVKSIKEDNSVSTSYHYKYDWLNGKFRQQPSIKSEIKYYIVFTDGSMQESTKQKAFFYEKGDTFISYSYNYR